MAAGRRSVRWMVWVGVMLLGIMGVAARVQADPVTVRVFVSQEPLVQGGSAQIAVEMTVAPPFHIQSSQPHDKELIATRVSLGDSPGISAGTIRYPAGVDIAGPPEGEKPTIVSAYQGTVYMLLPITVAADAPLGARTLSIRRTTQACNQFACLLPVTQSLRVEVNVVAAGSPVQQKNAEIFAAADRQTFSAAATTATAPPAITPGKTAVPAPPQAGLMSVAQQLAAIQSRDYRAYNAQHYPLGWIILLALLGGAILNIMPCVLPVIPLKVLSLVQQAHGNRRIALLHGLTFSAGIIALFIALAVVLKTAGLFYGQQFQSPVFLIVMVFFVVALALSMLGVWTLNPPQALYAAENRAPHTGYLGSFTNGLMATLLATPCSAPYLGPALAWAFAQPAWLTAMTLGLVGVGMSIPYLVLAVFPQALEKIPRAGRWSDLLKQGLGIVMLGVAVYLVTLIPNATLWVWVLIGAVVVGLVCWGYGQIPTFNMERATIWKIRTVVLILGAGLGVLIYWMAARYSGVAAPSDMANQHGWKPFNVTLLDEALAQHRPVVVDWTASWCINCHVLEAVVLNTTPVENAFRESGALLLKADLSTDNPPATLLNHKLGGEAIPALAVFSPSRPLEPVVLRDSYTAAHLIGEIQKAH